MFDFWVQLKHNSCISTQQNIPDLDFNCFDTKFISKQPLNVWFLHFTSLNLIFSFWIFLSHLFEAKFKVYFFFKVKQEVLPLYILSILIRTVFIYKKKRKGIEAQLRSFMTQKDISLHDVKKLEILLVVTVYRDSDSFRIDYTKLYITNHNFMKS